MSPCDWRIYGNFSDQSRFSDLRIYLMVIGGYGRFYLMIDGSCNLFNFGAQIATFGYKFLCRVRFCCFAPNGGFITLAIAVAP